MAKAHSPIRLDKELLNKATLASKQMHRSVSGQIEYWADIGERVSRSISPQMLTQIISGLARIQVEAVRGEPVDPEAVFMAVDRARENGDLEKEVTSASVRFQASSQYPGMLERIDQNGNVEVGQFKDGQFTPVIGEASW